MSRAIGRFAAGLALKGLLRTITGTAEPGAKVPPRPPRRRRRATARPPERAGTVATTPARRGTAFALMMGGAAVGLPLMLIFESTITRVVGVLALLAFIVAGVFAIADPAFLDTEEEERR